MSITREEARASVLDALDRSASALAAFDPDATDFVVCSADPDDNQLTVGERDGRTSFEFRTVPTIYPREVARDLAARWNRKNGDRHPVLAMPAREWRADRIIALAGNRAACVEV